METSSKSVFNLEARKRSQSWLWAAPKKVNIPRIEDAEWGRDPVDAFIGQRLEVKGLKPAAEIDPRAWLRRVQFAITGLPPSPAEIAGFLADTNLGSRERVVDRLLGSPHYGERWARHWMDLMRYAETRGHESDYLIANAWHYRDYLVRAFNTDVAYDRFLLEHLAGDLLPNPRFRTSTDINESVLGTGWVFLGEEVHSPVDIRQDECDRLDNKVDVFTKSFLGLTVSCARCHDHKYDPIPTRDYYSLYGVFQSSAESLVRCGQSNDTAFDEELGKRETKRRETMSKRREEQSMRVRPKIEQYLLAQLELEKYPEEVFNQVVAPEDINPLRLNQIQHFFEHYKDLEPGKWVKIHGWGGVADAHQEILEGIERYQKEHA